MIASHRELAQIHDLLTPVVEGALVAAAPSVRSSSARRAAQEELRELLALSQVYADLLGRRRLLLDLRPERELPGAGDVRGGTVGGIRAAIEQLLGVEPRLRAVVDAVRVRAERWAAEAVERAFSTLTASVVAAEVARGATAATVAAAAREVARSTAATASRTAATRAYADGWMEEAREAPGGLVVGLRFATAGDVDVRLNHAAAEGVIAAPDDPVWARLTPPLGFNCRCALELVDVVTAERAGLMRRGRMRPASIPPGAGPDRGFSRSA